MPEGTQDQHSSTESETDYENNESEYEPVSVSALRVYASEGEGVVREEGECYVLRTARPRRRRRGGNEVRRPASTTFSREQLRFLDDD